MIKIVAIKKNQRHKKYLTETNQLLLFAQVVRAPLVMRCHKHLSSKDLYNK